jgi:hypothetical protein
LPERLARPTHMPNLSKRTCAPSGLAYLPVLVAWKRMAEVRIVQDRSGVLQYLGR